MRYCIDLHNHSCLSPCGSDSMLPAVLAMEAADKGIDMLALTDHNSGRNLPAFAEACEIVGITGIFGLEVTTLEEIHVLTLFETVQDALEFGQWIESILPHVLNSARLFGNQLVCDVRGNIIEEADLFLYGPADITFDALIELTLSHGGLAIPAHIDRPANSVTANLGFLPELPYSAVESIAMPPTVETNGYTVTQGSDAHYIEHIGRRRCFIESASEGFGGLRTALEKGAVSYLGF